MVEINLDNTAAEEQKYREMMPVSDEMQTFNNLIKLRVLLFMDLIKEKDIPEEVVYAINRLQGEQDGKPLNIRELFDSVVVRHTDDKVDTFRDIVNRNHANAADSVSDHMPSKKEDQDKFAILYNEFVYHNKLFALLPPSVLAEQYEYMKNSDLAHNQPGIFNERIEDLTYYIDTLIHQYASGARTLSTDKFNYGDAANVADLYNGYMAMINAVEDDSQSKEYVREDINTARERLKNQMVQYDDYWGISGLEENLDKARENYSKYAKAVNAAELSAETLGYLRNLHFFNANEEEVAQFDNDGKVKKDSELEAIVDFARHNTLVANLTAEVPENADEAKSFWAELLNERVMVDAFAYASSSAAFNEVISRGDDFLNEDNLERFKQSLSDENTQYNISTLDFAVAKQAAANDAVACIERIGDKIKNPQDELLTELYRPIAKHDAFARHRFDGQKYNVNWFKTAGWTFASSLAMKAATYGVAKGALALGISNSMKATLPFVAGGTAMALSAVGVWINYKRFKKDCVAKNEKPKVKNFFTKSPYASINAASVLGFTAGACLLCGAAPVALTAGLGAAGVMGVSTYRDARKAGLKKRQAIWQSLKRVSAMVVGAGAGSYVGSLFGITPATVQEEQGTRTEAYTETINGPTTTDYSQLEHNHAAMRIEDPRFSEFLQRFHVAPDLQDASNPDIVSHDAVSNLRNGIFSVINGNYEYYSDVNGNFVPNTDVLAYKFEQMLYLAPNPDALINPEYAENVLHIPQGTTVGEYFSYTNPDGSTTNYVEAMQQLVTNGKVDNPQGFAELMNKVQDNVGMQIDDQPNELGEKVNDAGKVKFLGTGEPKSPVQSYNANADAGYDKHAHQETVSKEKVIKFTTHKEIPGEKLWAVGYWEPAVAVMRKLKKRIGTFADRLRGKAVITPTPTPEPTPADKATPVVTPTPELTPIITPTPELTPIPVVTPIITPTPVDKATPEPTPADKPQEPTPVDTPTPADKATPEPTPADKATPEPTFEKKVDEILRLYIDEFQIMYGYRPEYNDEAFAKYRERLNKEIGNADEDTILATMHKRRDALDDILVANAPDGNRTKLEIERMKNGHVKVDNQIIAQMRTNLWKMSLDADKYNHQWTLSALTSEQEIEAVTERGKTEHQDKTEKRTLVLARDVLVETTNNKMLRDPKKGYVTSKRSSREP